MGKSKISGLILFLTAVGLSLGGCSGSDNTETGKQSDITEYNNVSEVSLNSGDTESSVRAENSEMSISSENPEVSEEQPKESSNESSIIYTPVEAEWFDDAVIVGDSITLKLSYYCEENKDALGNAQFLCSGSLGWANAQLDIDYEGAVHPLYKGKKVLVEDCAKVTNAEKVFIMLGMNDVGLYGVDGTIENAGTLIDKILSNSPDAEIYIESVTPIYKDKQLESWNNKIISNFNVELEKLAKEKNCKYLDVYPIFADSEGNLIEEYCSDKDAMGIHFSDKACGKWVEYLRNHAE